MMKKRLQNMPRPRLMKRGKSGGGTEVSAVCSPDSDMNNGNGGSGGSGNGNNEEVHSNSAVHDLSDKDFSTSMPDMNAVVTPEQALRPSMHGRPPSWQAKHSHYEADELHFLQQQLRDAQRVVRAVLGETGDLDSNASLKAIKAFAKMQKELVSVNKDLSNAARQRNELETLYTNVCIQRNKESMEVALLKNELERKERMARQAEVAAAAPGSRAAASIHSASATFESQQQHRNKQYELELENKVQDLQSILEQRQLELLKTQQQLIKSRQETQNAKSMDPDDLHRHLDKARQQLQEAQAEVEELENERQMNMTEIVELSKELMSLKKGGPRKTTGSTANREFDDERMEALERDNLTLKTKVEDLMSSSLETKQQWAEEKESMEVELLSLQYKVLSIDDLRDQLAAQQKQVTDWQMQCDHVNSELCATKARLDEQTVALSDMEHDRAEEQARLADAENELDQMKRDQDFRQMEDLMTGHAVVEQEGKLRAEVMDLQLELREANRKLSMLENDAGASQPLPTQLSSRNLINPMSSWSMSTSLDQQTLVHVNQIRIEVNDPPPPNVAHAVSAAAVIAPSTVSKRVHDIEGKSATHQDKILELTELLAEANKKIEDLTTEVNELRAKEQSAAAFATSLEVSLNSARIEVEDLTKELLEANNNACANAARVEQLTIQLGEASLSSPRNGSSDILDLTMQVHACNATIEKLSVELVESKFEIERLTKRLESNEPLTAANQSEIERLTKKLASNASVDVSIQPVASEALGLTTQRLTKQLAETNWELERLRAQLTNQDAPVKGTAELNLEIRLCHDRIESLSNELLESQSEVDGLKAQLSVAGLSPDSSEMLPLKEQLAKTEVQLVKEMEHHQMLMDQVTELRSRLQQWQTQVEDLELERNFNQAKVFELNQLLLIETKSEADQALHDKAMQCAEVTTKLEAVTAELARTKIMKEKLEQEREVNKAKVAELSGLWESQAKIDQVKEEMGSNIEIATKSLARSERRVTELEMERARYVKKATGLSIELAGLKSTIDDLAEKLEHEEKANEEKDAIIKAAGIDSEEILAKLKEAMAAEESEARVKRKPLEYLSKQYHTLRGVAALSMDEEDICSPVLSSDSKDLGDADKAAGSLLNGSKSALLEAGIAT